MECHKDILITQLSSIYNICIHLLLGSVCFILATCPSLKITATAPDKLAPNGHPPFDQSVNSLKGLWLAVGFSGGYVLQKDKGFAPEFFLGRIEPIFNQLQNKDR